MKLPDSQASIESITAKPEAIEFVDKLMKQNQELSAIYTQLQPLLYELSVKLYKDRNETIPLQRLIDDSIDLIKGIPNE